MSGPWEKYAAAKNTSSDGPWNKYAAAAPSPDDNLTPEMRANLARNATPTQFEMDRAPRSRSAWEATKEGLSNIAEGVKQGVQGIGSTVKAAGDLYTDPGAVASDVVQGASEGAKQVAAVPGAIRDINQSTDPGAYYGEAASRTAGQGAGQALTALMTEGAAKGAGAAKTKLSPVAGTAADVAREAVPKSVPELTGTTPERIAELKQFPEKIEAVRQTAVNAEKQAHQAAKAAFPQFNEPIEVSRTTEQVPSSIVGEDGKPIMKTIDHVETTTFRDLQEQRSKLLQDIANEQQAVKAGAAPRYDLSDMYDKLHGIDETMTKAAVDQGGEKGLAQLQAARAQYAKYMQDFHNPGSPIKPILDMKPGETSKLTNHLLGADKGARTLETLRANGVDTTPIENMLLEGDRALRVNAMEQSKIRKVGDKYPAQRINESIRQVKYNELPSSAQARLPSSATRSKLPSALGEIPGSTIVSPKRITQFRLEHAKRILEGAADKGDALSGKP